MACSLQQALASMRRTASALALIAALSTSAAAEDKRHGSLAWGMAGLELGSAGDVALAFTTKIHQTSTGTLGLALGVFALGGGMAALAYKEDLGATGPIIAHGAAWSGFDLFLIGTLIDGRNERTRMKIGPTAIGLGIGGTIAGGLFASRSRTGTADSIWLGAAPGGFVAGGLAIGGMIVLATGIDGDKAPSQFALGSVIGLSLGVGFAAWYSSTQQPSASSSARTSLVPTVDIGAGRSMFSYGGVF